METPDRKATPFLSLRTPRTAAYLGSRIRMVDDTESGEDSDSPPAGDDIPPKPVETPPKGDKKRQEKKGPAMEDRLTDLTCRLVDEPSETLKMSSDAHCDAVIGELLC